MELKKKTLNYTKQYKTKKQQLKEYESTWNN